ncbi:MAG TPA: alpha-amylase family protein [Armatimonadota bacterium]|jgi:hypothetical protein
MPFPFRQVHLDFHTSPFVPDVGASFDPDQFAQTLRRAHVNSINLFAKCHHGHLYTNTSRPERHPSLPRDLDLLGRQIEACHRVGIKTPVYISVQCDEYAANTHPEWIAREPDGRPVGAGPLAPGWQILDMSSPYQDYLVEQTEEILGAYGPVDGLWFDMCWNQPSSSRYAQAAMDKAGLDPERPEDRDRFALQLARDYMRRLHRLTQEHSPGALVFFNCRPFAYLPEEIDCFEQIEIEALPTGGWGYMYFPKNVRLVRSCGKPYLGMTARFHKSWADFGGLKPYAALEYETRQMVAHGAQCCIGDQLHPRGVLDPAAYDLIGRVYAGIQEREPWLEGAKPVTQIAVFQGTATASPAISGVDEGVTRLLTQLKHQFDFVHADGAWEGYELVILPDQVQVDGALAQRLEAYVDRGGKVLATGTSGLACDATELALPLLGVKPEGMSAFTATYLRFGEAVADGVPATDHVFYDRGARVTPLEGTRVLAQVVEPYFQRSWRHFSSHQQTPADQVSPYAAATLRGPVACIPLPVFSAYGKHGNIPIRLLVRNVLNLLLPKPLLRVTAPTSTEATLTRQEGRTIAHLLQYCPERRADGIDIVEDIVPLQDVPLSLRMSREPSRAYLAPCGEPLKVEFECGYATVRVPEVNGHAMVVFED